jgi:hypothetical protein
MPDLAASLLYETEVAVTTTANLTLRRTHACTATSAAYTVTLPTPVGVAGAQVGVRITPSSTKLVTLATAAGNIGGAATRIMWAGESAILMSDGTNWVKTAGRTLPMMASIKQLAIQSLPTGAVTVLGFDGSDIDNIGLMVTLGTIAAKTGNITIQRAGVYSILCQFGMAAIPSGGATRIIGQVTKNAVATASTEIGSVAGTFPCLSLAQSRTLAVGDAITAAMYHTSASAVDTAGGGGATPTVGLVEVPAW